MQVVAFSDQTQHAKYTNTTTNDTNDDSQSSGLSQFIMAAC